ncbi:UDP-glucose 6-dehydrogenase [Paenibacillus sp. J31TS4]|uniref:UDP-glucose dehydrogenase family protein n=1 Tax=Paenibacillus sp. J31TS4 TaxID=2807195 RepID=UPI001B223DD4|nr:UDP-glucose/GDP-mannose dehydrogenase family protein [Paenibacillus sp. J31TS4]GIP39136.1 UDP-glucose 6-dehydrogenase [Paenibacillus sp. J31TS4]
MKIACIGSGYVGTVTGAAFAALGYDTLIIDLDGRKVDQINEGISPIYEPGLQSLLAEICGKTLRASTSYQDLEGVSLIFICVGTPSKEDGSADLSWIKRAAEDIARVLDSRQHTTIVLKSTVPVGTADFFSLLVEKESGLQRGTQFSVVSNPEFLREGFALGDFLFPDRIVVGVEDDRSRQRLRRLFQPILDRNYPEKLFMYGDADKPKPVYFETDIKSSEMIKYVSNAFLAVKVSYINEVARLCDKLGANVKDVAYGMGLDTRIGPKFLQVSAGWSGSCFPKDTMELLATSGRYGTRMDIVRAAVQSNEEMHSYCLEKLQAMLLSLNGKRIGILGLTFKPDTDDARATQASFFIRNLLEMGAHVSVYDPKGMPMFRALNKELPIAYCERGEDTAVRSDALLLLTHWEEFLMLPWQEMVCTMRTPHLLDTRNCLPAARFRAMGYRYQGVGIPLES